MIRTICFCCAAVLGVLGLCGCGGGVSTENIPAVTDFRLNRYMGVWYEIARLPHRFEDGLDAVEARYTLQANGVVKVVNTGVERTTGKLRRVEGVGEMKRRSDVGILKVSFFRPFYGEYRIILLDGEYRTAMVTSSTTDYLWILSREPSMEKKRLEEMLEQAEVFGFDTSSLIYPEQKETK